MNFDRTVYALVGLVLAMAVVVAFILNGPSGLGWIDHVGLEKKVKSEVAAQLLDPSSAQFRNVHRYGGTICGEVNGKNRYGAYVGFVRFMGTKISSEIYPQDDQRLFPELPGSSERFERDWLVDCHS